jgi:hypothetical protein
MKKRYLNPKALFDPRFSAHSAARRTRKPAARR